MTPQTAAPAAPAFLFYPVSLVAIFSSPVGNSSSLPRLSCLLVCLFHPCSRNSCRSFLSGAGSDLPGLPPRPTHTHADPADR